MMLGARTAAWSGKALPYLRRVAYLQSHGTEWIDLGIKGNGDSVAKIDFQYYQTSNIVGSGGVFGSRIIYYSNAFYFGSWDVKIVPGQKTYFNYGSQNPDKAIKSSVDLLRHVFVVSENGVIKDGNQVYKAFVHETFSTPTNLLLFDAVVGNVTTYCRGIVRVFKFNYEDANSKLSLIPVLDLSGRPAMYDEVSGQFFYNQGTGEFTWGEL